MHGGRIMQDGIMIEREKWAQLLGVDASAHPQQSDHGEVGVATNISSNISAAANVNAVTIANIATVILHEGEDEQLGASNDINARLMRVVYEEAPKDQLALLDVADAIEHYAQKEDLPLPIYASSTPSGRLVVNVCAFSSFDETNEAVECLHKITQKSPLELAQELTQEADREISRLG